MKLLAPLRAFWRALRRAWLGYRRHWAWVQALRDSEIYRRGPERDRGKDG